MKIAQIISTPPMAWATGGCARVVYDLSMELANRGHEVTIITTNLYEPKKRFPTDNLRNDSKNIRILRFPYISDWLAWKKKIYISIGMITYIRDNIKKYDIVHLQDLISIQAIATNFFCKKNQIPYILTTHGCLPGLTEKKIHKILYYKLFGMRILNDAYRIIALTSFEKRELMQLSVPEEKIIVIPNGITKADFRNLPERGKFRAFYNILETERMVLFLGRIHKIKGIDLLIKSFPDIIKIYPNTKLVIVGRDEGFLSNLQQLVKSLELSENILFTGPISEERKISAYIDADVYVLPSVHEGFPMTVLEVWACGTPVIVTKGCNISDIVDDSGIVIENNKDQLSNAIIKIFSDDKLNKSFVRQGFEHINTEYNWEAIAKRIECIYNKGLFNKK